MAEMHRFFFNLYVFSLWRSEALTKKKGWVEKGKGREKIIKEKRKQKINQKGGGRYKNSIHSSTSYPHSDQDC